MSEYRLARAQSAAIIRSPSVDSRPTVLLTRTYSVPDLTSYIRASDRYKPVWPYYYTRPYLQPYRYYRDWRLYDDYWYDRYTYYSPLYYSLSSPYRRYYYSDYLSNPYYTSYPSSYWTRYKSYLYDYDYPYYYRRYTPYYSWLYGSSYYNPYLSTSYRPYRPYYSYLLDQATDSILTGLEAYRNGAMNFSVLNTTYLDRTYWDKRFKSYKTLYQWENNPERLYIPSYFNRRSRHYFAEWA
ncbi:Protein R13H4.2 c [Aphelenchoides avenae]|nr:Protein R13H4.2 c [Aphelenchus avenae]